MTLNHPEATDRALAILRDGSNFQWYVIPVFAFVVYIYLAEAGRKNWKGIAAGLSLYAVHWLYEIGNALIRHFSGHALWTVPTGTSYLLLVGVGIELSLMFAAAGLILSMLLPEDPRARLLGINNRLAFAVGNAALYSVIEIFLASTPAFVWVYPWWGALPVFITVYVPFFLVSFLCYDWKPRVQRRFIGILFGIDAIALILFAGVLHWI
jgi:hypothetical protein